MEFNEYCPECGKKFVEGDGILMVQGAYSTKGAAVHLLCYGAISKRYKLKEIVARIKWRAEQEKMK